MKRLAAEGEGADSTRPDKHLRDIEQLEAAARSQP
jgi:hypothetical protein